MDSERQPLAAGANGHVGDGGGAAAAAAPRGKTRLGLLFVLLCAVVACFGVLAVTLAFVFDGAGLAEPHIARRVTVQNVMRHLEAFERASQQADPNEPTRAVGTPGYDASVQYVQRALAAYPDYFDVSVQPMMAGVWRATADAQLGEVAPAERALVLGEDFSVMHSSGSGASGGDGVVVAAVANTGCDAADWPARNTSYVAVVPFGGACTNARKLELAPDAVVAALLRPAAGASGLWNTRVAMPGFATRMPVFAVTHTFAAYVLAQTARVSFNSQTEVAQVPTYNVLARTAYGDNSSTVVVGAHLDSVPAGPGINDDGSGSASILEVALVMAADRYEPVNQIIFGWWAAEEIGLQGSRHYVQTAGDAERAAWVANVNNDMLGSPNWNRNVLRVDNATAGVDDRTLMASDAVRAKFEAHFERQELPFTHKMITAPGSSDYGYFLLAGVGASGVDTGAGTIKTKQQQALFGGIAGAPNDPLYHQRGDDLDNISAEALGSCAKAMADVVQTLASTEGLREQLYGSSSSSSSSSSHRPVDSAAEFAARLASPEHVDAFMAEWQHRV